MCVPVPVCVSVCVHVHETASLRSSLTLDSGTEILSYSLFLRFLHSLNNLCLEKEHLASFNCLTLASYSLKKCRNLWGDVSVELQPARRNTLMG